MKFRFAQTFGAHFGVITMTILAGFCSSLAKTGTRDGGGGSVEARTFVEAATESIALMSRDPSTKKYADQLLETLQTVKIDIVDSLDRVCGGKPKARDLYAYSCPGEIHLLAYYWSEDRRLIYNGKWHERWLRHIDVAQSHITDILHELFRAGDPRSPRYVTGDEAYSATKGILANTPAANISALKSECRGGGSDCALPFDEPILEQNYSCRVRGSQGVPPGMSSLQLELVGVNGKTASIKIGDQFPDFQTCRERANYLASRPPETVFGKWYYCYSAYAVPPTADQYVVVIKPDFSHFARKISDDIPVAECLSIAEEKTNQAHP